jgi:hypothetical protein
MLRHVLALAGAAGLLLFVAAGTSALLNGASLRDGTTWMALGGGAIAVAATVARGPESARRLRIIIGSMGLFVAVLAFALAVIGFGIGSDALPALVVGIMATVAYIQGAAAQGRLAIRVVGPWILIGLAVAIPTVMLALGIGIALSSVGLRFVGIAMAPVVAGLVLRAWSVGRSDRRDAPAAVARTAAGRPNARDRVIIERGPLALLRSIPVANLTDEAR